VSGRAVVALAATAVSVVAWPVAAAERTSDAPLDRFGPIGGAHLQLDAAAKDKTGTVALELPAGPSQEWRFGLILSTPLDDNNEGRPANLDGLANGTKLTLRVGRFDIPAAIAPDLRAREIEGEAIRTCEFERRNPAPGDKVLPVEGCRTEPISNIVHAAHRVREYNAHLLPYDATDYGLEAAVGVKDFKFLDPMTLAKGQSRKTQWSASVFYNQYLRHSKTAITFSIGYERAYKEADKETFCPAASAGNPVRCVTGAGAPPTRDESLKFAAGIRHQFMSKGKLLPLAIAPLVTYDALDDEWGVDLPVYFLSDSTGNLTGGMRLGYLNEKDQSGRRKDDITLGLFVGLSFSLFQ
jgi:hypothetical protein